MKLQSVSYNKGNDFWHSPELVPDTPRSILIYTEDGGEAEGCYSIVTNKWMHFRWNCEVFPKAWREMPKYENKNCVQ